MDQAYDELMAQAEKLADTQKLLEEVSARAQALEQSLGQRDRALAEGGELALRLGDELRRAGLEAARRDGEIAELTAIAAEVSPLREVLAERDERVAHLEQVERTQLERIEELAPLAESVPGLLSERDETAQRNRDLDAQLALVSAEAELLAALRVEVVG